MGRFISLARPLLDFHVRGSQCLKGTVSIVWKSVLRPNNIDDHSAKDTVAAVMRVAACDGSAPREHFWRDKTAALVQLRVVHPTRVRGDQRLPARTDIFWNGFRSSPKPVQASSQRRPR